MSILNTVSRRKEVEDDCVEGYWARSWSFVDHVEEVSQKKGKPEPYDMLWCCRSRRNWYLHKWQALISSQ